jgi:hypothetical protein
MSVATSPDSGLRTPRRSSPVQTAKSSPVKIYDKYYRPENREQYQKFGYDRRFMLGAFTEAEFLDYLDFKVQNLAPEPQAFKDKKEKGNKEKMQDFSHVASAVAKAIKDRREHYLFLCLAFLPDI